jgi:hypothetical protein
MRANLMNQFVLPTTSTLVTPITSTAQLALTVVKPDAGSHVEDSLDPVGLFVKWSAVTLAGSNTYRFQVQQSSDNAGQSAVLTVADTGAMAITDPRLVNVDQLFLAIDWSLVTQKYLTVLLTLAGNGTPSISILMADLRNASEVSHPTAVAANYTP